MTIEYNGEVLTIQQASKYLESPDREIRKEIFEKIFTRRLEDKEKLDNLLNELLELRNAIAKNAGYESFVEYQWDVYDRFDYTQEDVFKFHEGVRQYIVPLAATAMDRKKQSLGLDIIKPYDVDATDPDKQPLKPFSTGDELLEKGIESMGKVHPQFAENLRKMKEK